MDHAARDLEQVDRGIRKKSGLTGKPGNPHLVVGDSSRPRKRCRRWRHTDEDAGADVPPGESPAVKATTAHPEPNGRCCSSVMMATHAVGGITLWTVNMTFG